MEMKDKSISFSQNFAEAMICSKWHTLPPRSQKRSHETHKPTCPEETSYKCSGSCISHRTRSTHTSAALEDWAETFFSWAEEGERIQQEQRQKSPLTLPDKALYVCVHFNPQPYSSTWAEVAVRKHKRLKYVAQHPVITHSSQLGHKGICGLALSHSTEGKSSPML